MKIHQLLETSNQLSPDQVNWLESLGITRYSAENGVVDVYGNVDIPRQPLRRFPVRFGYVSGFFNCSECHMTSLVGAPREVGGTFYGAFNNLTTLEGGPTEVGGNYLAGSNHLTSLKGAPREVGGNFWCHNNSLTSLEHAPRVVGRDFSCGNNNFNSTPDHSHIDIGGKFLCKDNL